MYEPFEIKLRYPENVDPSGHWSTVWADSFKVEAETLVKQETPKSINNELDSAIKVLRLMEVVGSSIEQGGKRIDNINLVSQEGKHDWVTLGSDAGINEDALMGSRAQLENNSQVIGCIPGPGKTATNDKFKNLYSYEPSVAMDSVDELIEKFDKDHKLLFYYPILPSPLRDENTIRVLKHFKNSIILVEKPSHNRAAEALAFKKRLEQDNLTNRVIVGFHDTLSPSRARILELAKQHKDDIVGISAKFNYPKNPHDPSSYRIYDPTVGGTMLDLGVYVYRVIRDIMREMNMEMKDFDKDKSKIQIKYSPEGVDIEQEAWLQYSNGLKVYQETKVNPGSDHQEDLIINLRDGSKITQQQYVHPIDSCGVFIEHYDGTVTDHSDSLLTNGKKISSNANQIDFVQKHHE